MRGSMRYSLLFALWAVLPAAGASLPFARLDDIRGPYRGTGAFGEAMYVQPLGVAGGWPITAVWSSGNAARSPHLGFGWSIPALESRFVQLDERRWAFHQPDGYVRIFVRAPAEGRGVLTGGPAWRAVLDADSVRVTADPKDGGPKSVFSFWKGRLVRMDGEEGSYEVKYAGRAATAVLAHGRKVLDVVEESSGPERRVVFRFAGAAARAVAVCRPATVLVATEGSSFPEPVQEPCLARLETAEGLMEFAYGGDAGEAFFTAGGVRWTWDPRTRKIRTCGGWTYSLADAADADEAPSFARRRADGRRESYSCSRRTGLCEQTFVDGSRRAYKMFTSGPLAFRRVRWTKETARDGAETRTDYTYNEAGQVVYLRVARTGAGAGTDEMWLDKSGKVARRRVDGKEVALK